MVRILTRAAIFILFAFAVLYAGDYVSARIRMPGDLATIQVQTLWAIKTKNGRMDYELGDSESETCVGSLFPHMGYLPCWYLRSHTQQVVKVGRADRKSPRTLSSFQKYVEPHHFQ